MNARIELQRMAERGAAPPTPVVTLRVRDRYGAYADLLFRVDTQADVATIPIPVAKREAIPFAQDRPGAAVGLTGKVAKFRGRVRLRIAGREYDWPCDFVEAVVDPETKQPLDVLRPVLGRAGLLDEFAVCVDSGFLILTRLGPARRLLRRFIQKLWEVTGRIHPADEPL